MKKIAIAILMIIAAVSAAAAETVPATPAPAVILNGQNQAESNNDAAPVVSGEPQINVLPQPYEAICAQLSNGKDAVLQNLSIAVLEKVNEPAPKILENLGAAASKQYAGDPLLGMTKFCGSLDWCETLEAQLKAVAAFAKGYKTSGVVVIPLNCTEGDPQTKLEMQKGKFAWFIPFRSGTNFTVTLLGKKDTTAKIWKILGDKPVSKEWQGGFWEREIRIEGK